ncbi:SOS response-associated peptidase family protein [Sphingomonas asaccharolytica]|uniref:SOS response-associated peptidase family protein n=1 Tax=Sphingomonas asaccharolytica TaxID=40681 RepID=UPI00082A1928|nr:SOS response-associated peptidase family protein [Sphingomonas asaccharolytica]
MARLFVAQVGSQEIADQFGVEDAPIISMPSEMTEGLEGPIVIENGGRRLLKVAHWGFPRRTLKAAIRGEEPGIIGLVADLTNPMWDTLVVDPRYRCLIPLTHFANPAGDQGSKTRSWFSVKGEPLVAWAGFCRNLPDVGPVFAGMTMTASDAVMPYNDRMPVLLGQGEYARWLHGSISDVIEFQFRAPMAAERIEVTHTDDRWRSGDVPEFAAAGQIALL